MAERDRDQPPPSYPRLQSSLHIPDSDAWRQRRNYLPALADALRYAYFTLHAGQQDAYFHAYAALIPFRAKILCPEQRLRIEYAMALAYAGEHATPQSLGAVARALEAAEELHDEVALVELAYLAGALAHSGGQHDRVFGHYADALEALRCLERQGVAADPMLELDLVLRLGWRACELGHFSQGLHLLDEAYRLRALWPMTSPSQAASLSWLDAQLALVVRGNPVRALDMARPAAGLLLEISQPINAARAHTFVAECAIELARSPSVHEDPRAALKLARDTARQAQVLARQTHDVIGKELARLALLQAARVERELQGASSSANALPALERILRTAEKLDDIALTGRVETAMGNELVAQDDRESARTMYLRARAHLEEHFLSGLAFWPRRALRQIAGE